MSCSANIFRTKLSLFRVLFGLWLVLASQLVALGTQSVTLKWNPSTDPNVAGYRIYYGPVSHNYTNVITVGNVTTATISGLAEGTTYFFAATTTGAAGRESDYSNEASFTTAAAVVIAPVIPVVVNQPPTLNDLTNVTVYQNAGAQTIALNGITAGSPGENQVLKVTVATSNASLIAKPTVNYTSPATNAALVFKPATTLTGTSIITVTVNDGGKSNNIITKQFVVTVIAPPNLAIPKFSKPLTNSTAIIGQTITLTATVTGKAPFKYQWKFNGKNLPGATGPTLILKNIKANQTGSYSVSVSNTAGATNGVILLSVYATTTVKPAVVAPAIDPATTAATLTAVKKISGQFAFAVSGIAGCKYVVQATSDFKNWANVQTNASPFTFTDTNTSNVQKRFYRTYYIP